MNLARHVVRRFAEPFEAYLLEVLSDFQITIPEIGTVQAQEPPIVVITSNRTREIHDALKRRCLYHWVGYPDAPRELEILRRKAPGVPEQLTQEIVGFIQELRNMDLFKLPGVAETIDWTRALNELDAIALDPDLARLVELRFFAGLTIAETAKVLDVSTPTVERGWRTARRWLRTNLREDAS